MWDAGYQPLVPAHSYTPAAKIIERAKPPALSGDIDIIAWFAQWLWKWSFYAFPNEDVRDSGLSLALEKQRRS
jgi:hypothetical protein